jgi:peptidoglycan/LPS O-acetylase OafA/YrhL
LWLGAAVGSVSLLAMFFYPGAKLVVVAAGALLLAPCLLAYLTGRPLPGISGRVLKWLGVRTYSIYLWQEPFTICGFLPGILQPVGALVSIAVGAVWFHWFERPFLSAGRQK